MGGVLGGRGCNGRGDWGGGVVLSVPGWLGPVELKRKESFAVCVVPNLWEGLLFFLLC